MVNCKCCAKQVSPNAQFCPHCGEPKPQPDPPPAPITLTEVFKSTGIDRRTLVVGVCVFFGVGLAAWSYQDVVDNAATRQSQEKAAAENAKKREELVRQVVGQQPRKGP
jgi:hypothetical protein